MAQKNPPPPNAQIEDVIAAVATAIYDAFPVFDQDGTRQTDFAGRISGGVVGQSIGWVFRIEGVTAQAIIDWIKAQFSAYSGKTAPTPGGASWMAAWTDLLGNAHDFSAKLETQFKGSGGGGKPAPVFDPTQASNGANIDNAKRGQGFYGMDGKNHYLAPGFVPENPDPAFVAARAALLAAYPDAPPTPAPTPTPDPGPTGFPGIG